jgi:hypothetical protein
MPILTELVAAGNSRLAAGGAGGYLEELVTVRIIFDFY